MHYAKSTYYYLHTPRPAVFDLHASYSTQISDFVNLFCSNPLSLLTFRFTNDTEKYGDDKKLREPIDDRA